MLVVGVVEVVAGIFVAIKPWRSNRGHQTPNWRLRRVRMAVGIIFNLLLIPGFFDVALRDFGLALGALAPGRLSQEFDSQAVAIEMQGR